MSVTHRTLGVAQESSFGSLLASTNLPTPAASYISIPCEMDPILIYGEPVASERNDARDGNYFNQPEPDTVYDSNGDRVRRRTGQVQLRVDLTTIGTAANNYNTNYLGYLLDAGFLNRTSGVTSATVATITSSNAFTVASGGPTASDVGTLISTILNGKGSTQPSLMIVIRLVISLLAQRLARPLLVRRLLEVLRLTTQVAARSQVLILAHSPLE